jgi:predicted DsbA family dithiol-disulfide isomerase
VVSQQAAEERDNNKNLQQVTDGVDITYYTDPLCCWSWALEPQWRKLLNKFSGKIHWNYCMGGLIPDWNNYNDPVNSVTRPIQMGPVWMHAGQLSGRPIEHNIWMKDPPASSYPACIAVKCAQLQSAEAADRYLILLRETCMFKGINIARESTLMDVAESLAEETPDFNLNTFGENLKNDTGLEAFRKDLQQVQYLKINRFPTLIFRRPQQASLIITGYQPFSVLVNAIQQMAPEL